jgi:ABC-type glycerol-3-phosphate transport system substrate-binding protein
MQDRLRAHSMVLMVGLAALMVCALGLATCSSAEVHATLTLWYHTNCPEAAALPDLLSQFHIFRPELNVASVGVPDDQFEARLTQARASDAPDVLVADDINTACKNCNLRFLMHPP